jgi:hypothetical protein
MEGPGVSPDYGNPTRTHTEEDQAERSGQAESSGKGGFGGLPGCYSATRPCATNAQRKHVQTKRDLPPATQRDVGFALIFLGSGRYCGARKNLRLLLMIRYFDRTLIIAHEDEGKLVVLTTLASAGPSTCYTRIAFKIYATWHYKSTIFFEILQN